MRLSKVFTLALVALLLSGCGLVAFFVNDSRVTVSKLSEQSFRVSTAAENMTANDLRINSSDLATITLGDCTPVETITAGKGKAFRCKSPVVELSTNGTLDVGLVPKR